MLNGAFRDTVERAIRDLNSDRDSIARISPLGGGCINDVGHLRTVQGESYLLKANRAVPDDFFAKEAEGLRAMNRVGKIRVPKPLCDGICADSGTRFLLTEYIEGGRQGDSFHQTFGQQLAEFHRQGEHTQFGFTADNYLGSTRQVNPWTSSWVEFFGRFRIGYQIELANEKGVATSELNRLGDRLTNRLADLLGAALEAPVLIHGDLWSGNYLCDEHGQPVLIDPAAYYGHREAELAMTQLFGGFPHDFYAAYHETWALEDGWEDRLEIYKLYHLLNHLNLFGSSYLGGCLAILRRFAG